jgi:hypothetical protein
MIPLHHDPHYTFRFADDRIIPRFHLEGVGAGRRVDVFRIDPATGERLGLLTTGWQVTAGGWTWRSRSPSGRGTPSSPYRRRLTHDRQRAADEARSVRRSG